MSTNSGGWARSLAGAGAGLAFLGAALNPASAADIGGSCCADLEERVAELEATTARKGNRNVDLKISGAVGRALLFWDDGTEQNVYSVDNAKNASTFALEGEAGIAPGWKAGFTLGVDAISAGSDRVDQFNDSGNAAFLDLADAFFFIANERLGTIRVGQTDSATDKIDNFLLTGADVVADNAVQDFSASFFIRSGSGAVLDARWEDFIPAVAGTNANLVTYVSPEWMGFTASASVGMDDWQDAALRYRGEWAQAFDVQAGIGFYRNTTEGHTRAVFDPLTGAATGDQPIVEDEGWGAGFAVLHKPTGLNIAFNYSTLSHTDKCSDRGAVSLDCRGDDEFMYVTGGIIRDLVPVGPTSFYGEYYRGTREWNDSQEGKLRAFATNSSIFDPNSPNFIPNVELKESEVTVWGFGVVQKFNDSAKPVSRKDKGAAKEAAALGEPAMELFVGYKHYELDVELIGRNAASAPVDVAAKKLNDFDAVVTGAIIRF